MRADGRRARTEGRLLHQRSEEAREFDQGQGQQTQRHGEGRTLLHHGDNERADSYQKKDEDHQGYDSHVRLSLLLPGGRARGNAVLLVAPEGVVARLAQLADELVDRVTVEFDPLRAPHPLPLI